MLLDLRGKKKSIPGVSPALLRAVVHSFHASELLDGAGPFPELFHCTRTGESPTVVALLLQAELHGFRWGKRGSSGTVGAQIGEARDRVAPRLPRGLPRAFPWGRRGFSLGGDARHELAARRDR